MKRHRALCSILFLCASPLLNAQGVGLSGDIRGTITDFSGAVTQKVSVAVVQTDRGVRYTAATDSNGNYRMTALGPGTYEVSAAVPGFEAQVRKSVDVTLRETVVVDFRLRVSPRAETVEVMSELPVVDPASANDACVNNLVGAAFAPPFNVRGTSAVSPSQPLGFTAAFPKRELQLGIRFEF